MIIMIIIRIMIISRIAIKLVVDAAGVAPEHLGGSLRFDATLRLFGLHARLVSKTPFKAPPA